MNIKKAYFGIWNGNNQVEWFKSEKQGFDYLENYGLDKYKNIFEYNLEEINDFCYNSDEIENILKEKISEEEDRIGEESQGKEYRARDQEVQTQIR